MTDYIEITSTPESIIVDYNGKERYYSKEEYDLCRTTDRIELRRFGENPLDSELELSLPIGYTIINYI